MTIQTHDDIIHALQSAQQLVTDNVAQLSDAQFNASIGDGWSASLYLKHLIMSVKPVARSLQLPKDKMQAMFGQAERDSRSYDELVAKYQQRISNGMRAEDAPSFTPDNFKIPEDVDDVRGYLVETWNKANKNLITSLNDWSEDDLDHYVLPHPAIGNLTIREMCFFTIHHNNLHANDIGQAS